MTQQEQQPEKCKTCRVDWKRCGLRLQDCTKTFPISNMDLELILQMNENLPTDEMELVIRDLIVMGIRECRSHPHTPSATEQCKKCYDDGYSSGIRDAAATIRNQTLDEAITECEWDHPITQEDVWRKLESLRHTEAQQ